MFKNNRKKSGSNWALPLYATLLLAFGAALALCYVRLEMRGEALGARIKQLELEHVEARRHYDNEVWKWERTKSVANIEEALRRHDIVMVWPDEMNIVRLRETGVAMASLQDLAGQVARLERPETPPVTLSAHD